jgi:hypothetical protein
LSSLDDREPRGLLSPELLGRAGAGDGLGERGLSTRGVGDGEDGRGLLLTGGAGATRGVLETDGAERSGALYTGARDGLGVTARGASGRAVGGGTRTTGAGVALLPEDGLAVTVGRPPASAPGTVAGRPPRGAVVVSLFRTPRGWLGVVGFGFTTVGVVERGVTVVVLGAPPDRLTALFAVSAGRAVPRMMMGLGERGESALPPLALPVPTSRTLAGLAVLPLVAGAPVVGREPMTRGLEVEPAGRAVERSPLPLVVVGFNAGRATVSVRASASKTSRRDVRRGRSDDGRRDTGRMLAPDALDTVSTGTPRLIVDWLTVV